MLLAVLAIAYYAHFVLLENVVVLPQLGVLVRHLLHLRVCLDPVLVLFLPLHVGILELLFQLVDCLLHLALVLLEALDDAGLLAELLEELGLSLLVSLVDHGQVGRELLSVLGEVPQGVVELELEDGLLALDWVDLLDLVLGVSDHVVTLSVELSESELQAFLVVQEHEAAHVSLELLFSLVSE